MTTGAGTLLIASITVATVGPAARAAPADHEELSPAQRLARSDLLFAAGKRAQAEHDLSTACEDFEGSYVLAPRVGTLLNLGLCREEQGHLLDARAKLQRALQLLRQSSGREDRQRIAQEHLRAVDASLCWIDLELSSEKGFEQVELMIDGVPTPLRAGPVAVEAGVHVVSVVAPGSPPRSLQVSLGAQAKRETIQLAPLISSPALVTREQASPLRSPEGTSTVDSKILAVARAPSAPTPSRRTWLWAAVGVALAAGVLSAVLISNPRTRYPSSDVSVYYP